MKLWIKELYIKSFRSNNRISIQHLRFVLYNGNKLAIGFRLYDEICPSIQEAINVHKGKDENIIQLKGIWW